MLREYIQTALSKAEFKTIENPEPVFGEIPCCPGVWATGKTMEECRRTLEEVLEEWILVSVRLGNPIPAVEGVSINIPEATAVRE
jgi:predicted RNase H-like HicB family nuclease